MSALREALRDLPDAVFADLLESEDAYLLVVDLPGVTRESVDVTVEDRQVRIEGRRDKDLPAKFRYVTEDRSLFLDAEVPLPPDAASEGAEASMDRGVLSLRIPKRARDEGTVIEIRDADDGGNGDAREDESGDTDDGASGDGDDGGNGDADDEASDDEGTASESDDGGGDGAA